MSPAQACRRTACWAFDGVDFGRGTGGSGDHCGDRILATVWVRQTALQPRTWTTALHDRSAPAFALFVQTGSRGSHIGAEDRWVAVRQLHRRLWLLVAWALLCVLSGALLLSAQRQGERDITRVFEDRAEVAARLTETYTRDLLEQERRVAMRELSAPSVSAQDFERVTNLFGYEAAVLLDAHGRALRVAPATLPLIGQILTGKYAHLRAAAAGRTAVSNVVPSAAQGIPIVAFATPFDSRHGRRVFSGAFDVRTTPIGAYLRRVTPLKGAHVYLYDSAGMIVASNRNDLVGLKTLARADPDLAGAMTRGAAGRTGGGYQFASRRVGGAPWRLVIAVPRAQLLEPIEGARRYLPWLLWAAAVLGGLACSLLVGNLIASRAKLRDANESLDQLARIDALTGLYNRRQMQDSLNEASANAREDEQPLSVLMIDADHFKHINDTYGHDIGDEALRLVASVVRTTLRAGDVAGRWGGEEFLAILPSTDRTAAGYVAERVREAVASTPLIIAEHLVSLSVSIGVATHRDQPTDALVAAADTAMYAAKAGGRDRVRSADA